MSPTQVDAAKVKAEQRKSWDAISAGWSLALDSFERGAAATTAQLLSLAGVRPGQSVLDVATGLGEPALTAADVVGPSGRVVGTDISPAMLEAARRRAGDRRNVTFVVADVESIDLPEHSFDVALSRFGLMFAVDHVAAFAAIARLLAPGGVLAAAVWAQAHRVPMLSLGYAVMQERLALPPLPPGAPGPFGMADPQRLADELAAAGFEDVSVEESVVPFRLDGPQEYADFNRKVSPPQLLSMVDERYGAEADTLLWGPVGEATAPYRQDDGSYLLASVALVMRAVAAR